MVFLKERFERLRDQTDSLKSEQAYLQEEQDALEQLMGQVAEIQGKSGLEPKDEEILKYVEGKCPFT